MTPYDLPDPAITLYLDILRLFDDLTHIDCTDPQFAKGYFANSLTIVLSQYTITTGDPKP